MAGEREKDGDPRVYMAAERTFLAWIRTGVALMGFGFIVARFGLFLREIAAPDRAPLPRGSGSSIYIGLGLIALGVVVNVAAGLRHRRYVEALDAGRFRTAFGSGLAFTITSLLALLGVAMAVYLAAL
ncbi:MAG: YidH family protein [Candidatus Binatia bacterium]